MVRSPSAGEPGCMTSTRQRAAGGTALLTRTANREVPVAPTGASPPPDTVDQGGCSVVPASDPPANWWTAMPTLSDDAVRSERFPPALVLPGPRCDVCPHPVPDHDAIGLRFCRATRNSRLDRGCVCRPA